MTKRQPPQLSERNAWKTSPNVVRNGCAPMPIWSKGGNWSKWRPYESPDGRLGLMLCSFDTNDQLCIEQTDGGLYLLRQYVGDTREDHVMAFRRSWHALKQIAELLWIP